MSKKILYLVDGTSLCYRSFFAIKLSTSRGFPTGAIYGVYQTLKKILSKYNPQYIGVCFDVSRKTFRTEKFREYKLRRPPLPEGLKSQIPLVKKLISCLGIQIIEKERFEADDVIAALCKEAVDDGASCVIVSSDKDLYQLINTEGVLLYNYHKDKLISKDDFFKENGFSPELMVDYLALAGDSTDNIPGAKGIGKVGAAKLIQEFKTVENIFDNIKKLSPRMQEIIKENRENIFLSKELVKLQLCDVGIHWQDLKIGNPDISTMYDMFSELEFKTFLKEIPTPPLQVNIEVKEVISKSLLQNLAKEPLVLTIQKNDIFIYSYNENCIYKTSYSNFEDILKNPQIKKVSHDFKEQLFTSGSRNIVGLWFDVKIAAYLLDSSLFDYSLSNLAAHYLGEHLRGLPQQFRPYFIYKLWQLFFDRLREQKLDELFFKVEMPLVGVLYEMQKAGVRVEVKVLNNLLKEVDKKIQNNKEKIVGVVGHEFNLNSPKQLGAVLFQELKIPPLKKTKTGYSTNEEVLEKLSSQYPIAQYIIEYRHLNKLKTTYITPLLEEVRRHKGMLHTQFHQTSTQTGRLSSSSPNLQSIPQKGEFSQNLRKAFFSSFPKGYILSGDYSQIELRILAHLSGDKNLIEAFRENRDIHSHTAALLFGIKSSEVTDTQRNIAKRVNFGIIYGMSSYGLAKELKIGPAEAQNFIDDYFRRYPAVKQYIEKLQLRAEKDGYVTTILRRRRILPEIKSSNPTLREFAYRQAINAPIQGSCADLIKVAMVRIYNELKQRNFETKLIIQIHDELIFDVPESELKEVSAIVKKHMEKTIILTVPIKVNLKVGKNWGQLEDLR